jgi:hypothetical protein
METGMSNETVAVPSPGSVYKIILIYDSKPLQLHQDTTIPTILNYFKKKDLEIINFT